jgi:hypothetical protein
MPTCDGAVDVPPAPRDGALAELVADDGFRLGYGACSFSGCICLTFQEPYDSTTLCANCTHDYSMHA